MDSPIPTTSLSQAIQHNMPSPTVSEEDANADQELADLHKEDEGSVRSLSPSAENVINPGEAGHDDDLFDVELDDSPHIDEEEDEEDFNEVQDEADPFDNNNILGNSMDEHNLLFGTEDPGFAEPVIPTVLIDIIVGKRWFCPDLVGHVCISSSFL